MPQLATGSVFWRYLFTITFGVVAGMGVLLYTHLHETLQVLSWLLAIAVSFGAPCALFVLTAKRVPLYRAAIDGKPPFEGLKSLPLRAIIAGGTAVGGVAFAFGTLSHLGSYIDAYWL